MSKKTDQSSWDTYKRLLTYVAPYKWELAVAFLAMLFFALFQVMISAVAYITVNGLINEGGVNFSNLPHLAFLQGVTLPLVIIPFFIGFVFVSKGIFEFISSYFVGVVGLKAVRNIRNDIYSHLNYLSLDFFSKGRTGDLMSRTINDVNYIQGAVTDVLVDLVKSPAVILFNIPLMFFLGGKLGLIAIVVLPLIGLPVALMGRKVRKFTKRSQESTADVTSVFHEAITGIRVVKAFNQEEEEIKKFRLFNGNVFRYLKRQAIMTILQGPIVEMLGGIAAAVGLWYGLQYLGADQLAGFMAALYVFYEPVKKLSKVNSAIQRSIASGNRIFEIIDTPQSVADKPDAGELKGPIKSIEFRTVGFHYDKPDEEGRQFKMENVNLDIKAGEVVALVGSSGSGKTSLVNLLPRFYDVTEGAILVNGTDIQDVTMKSLRGHIGTVTQDVVLFNNTVHGNIAYGSPEATREDVIKAARAGHAHDFVERLQEGYETNIGERGVQLSGGQRQRLSIARAVLRNPPILILDEATSSLDTESEREVQKALEELMEGRTVFVVAHRLSTVQHADRILVFDNGQIIQEGTHKVLLGKGGQYKRLHDLQFNI